MPDRLRAYKTLRFIDARTLREIREVALEDIELSAAEAAAVMDLAQAVPDGVPAWPAFYQDVTARWQPVIKTLSIG